MAQRGVSHKRPTQVDVARRAAVSQPVVSYVLSGAEHAVVAPETRERVLQAALELGYLPHHGARSLRRQRTFTIAGIIPDITNPFYPAFERGIQDVAEKHGYVLIVYNTDGVADKEHRALESARAGRADAVIITPMHSPLEALRPLVEWNIPVVALSGMPFDPLSLPIDVLTIDAVMAAYVIVEHLIDRGYQRIAMVAGEINTSTREDRVLGYTRALRAHARPVDQMLVRNGDFNETGGYTAMKELLQTDPLPDAVFAANDLMAMGAMLAIREAGLTIPGDIAIAGFDDIPAARMLSPALTTIAQYPERLGRRGAEMALERLNESVTGVGRSETHPFSLIVRAST